MSLTLIEDESRSSWRRWGHLLPLLALGCTTTSLALREPGAESAARDASSFEVLIAPGPRSFHYEYEYLLKAVDQLPESAWRLRLNGTDVARYRVNAPPSDRVEIELTPTASARLRAHPDSVTGFDGGYFDVRLNGVRQYAAMSWARCGQAAINTPVVHVEPKGGVLVLRIGAWEGSWCLAGIDDTRIDRPWLRTFFKSLSLLEQVKDLGRQVP